VRGLKAEPPIVHDSAEPSHEGPMTNDKRPMTNDKGPMTHNLSILCNRKTVDRSGKSEDNKWVQLVQAD
jgi:hypothetical protein